MLLIVILVVLVVLLFGGGFAAPDARNVLWIIAVILLIWLLVSALR